MGTQAIPSPRAEPVEKYLPAIESLLAQIIKFGGFDLNFTVRQARDTPREFEAPDFVVDFSGRDSDQLLAGAAALLNALEYVVLKAVRLEEELFGRITFDCQDFRRLRAEELRMMARVAAERVVETGESFAFNPMSARERRIVHLALKDQPKVRTLSEGVGKERKVVILPAKLTPPNP